MTSDEKRDLLNKIARGLGWRWFNSEFISNHFWEDEYGVFVRQSRWNPVENIADTMDLLEELRGRGWEFKIEIGGVPASPWAFHINCRNKCMCFSLVEDMREFPEKACWAVCEFLEDKGCVGDKR